MILALLACGSDDPLVYVDRWEVVRPSDDPFADAPPGARCDPLAWRPEDLVLEVDTERCDYLTLVQALGRDARRGIEVPIWNLGTWAPEPAEAHLAVAVGETVWDARAPIPGPARAWTAVLDVQAREGDRMFLHLHNHGTNSWRFGSPQPR